MQDYLLNETRLGIPVITTCEGLSGVLQDGCTIFPQALAQGSTFNPELIYAMTRAAGTEAKALGHTPDPLPRARPGPGATLGTRRGDVRGGPLPDGRNRQRIRAGLPFAQHHLHAQTLYGPRFPDRRTELRERQRRRTGTAQPLSLPVQTGYPGRPRPAA